MGVLYLTHDPVVPLEQFGRVARCRGSRRRVQLLMSPYVLQYVTRTSVLLLP
jgi:hypothetical protein